MKLSDTQRKVLGELVKSVTEEEWLDLSGRGVTRATVRALLAVGALEQKTEGFPGQMNGQVYRVTPSGRAAVVGRRSRA